MGQNMARDPPPSLPAATYWRRRFIALLAGMSVLALVAWAFSGALDASRASGGPTGHRPPHSPAASSPATSPSASPTPSASGSSTPTTKKSSKAHPHPSTSATSHKVTTGKNKHRTPTCPAYDVVLSLFSSQGSYATGQDAQFQIDVVSTADTSCNFDVGARHVVLQVTKGTRIVWTSAQCAEGAASLITTLHRGVPTIIPMTWNGRRSSAGCPVPGPQAGRGSYTAVAIDGTLHSNPVNFRLG